MYDIKLELKDAGAITADAAGQVDSSDQILDVGSGLVEGMMIVDVSAIEIGSGDEKFKISLQGSSQSDFSSDFEDLVILELGAQAVLGGDQDSSTGRYKIPISNERNGTVYQYLRSYTDVSGTISTGINYTAYLTN